MAAIKLKVTYADEREVFVLATPRAQVETERHYKTAAQAREQEVESSFFLAWASLKYSGRESAEFERWLDLVADVEQVQKDAKDEAATDPTPPAPEPTGSSD